MAECLQATGQINLVIASKHPLPMWLGLEDAVEHVRLGTSRWAWASNDEGEPDVVLASCGTIPTMELLAATSLLREEVPALRVRFVNVTNLFTLARPEAHPDGMSEERFREVFTDDRPVIFNFHGYPSAVHQLIHRRPRQERFHVRGYAEEGTTTTPFELLAMNGVDRFQLAIDALSRADIAVSEMVRGMSGAFAVRSVPGAQDAIETFSQRRDQLRKTVRERGDDPDEIKNWVWPSGDPVAA
jgi:xylulose-5-phosphate/fructose-6-phosphate phosphoketolase